MIPKPLQSLCARIHSTYSGASTSPSLSCIRKSVHSNLDNSSLKYRKFSLFHPPSSSPPLIPTTKRRLIRSSKDAITLRRSSTVRYVSESTTVSPVTASNPTCATSSGGTLSSSEISLSSLSTKKATVLPTTTSSASLSSNPVPSSSFSSSWATDTTLTLPTILQRKKLPSFVRMVEVGPRDGLQNEPGKGLDTVTKIELIERLIFQGNCTVIEAGSMVSKKAVPAMADTDLILQKLKRKPGTRLSVLTPNLIGFKAAIANQANEVAVFGAATDAFSQKNINCNVMDSLQRFAPIMEEAKQLGIPVRGYVSCVVGCPYSGPVNPSAVAWVAGALRDLGCYEISLGDTIGVGTPWSIKRMLHAVVYEANIPPSMLALHAHDTYGSGLANVMAALECGIAVIDSSVAGLGGCPYAGGGASGNVATEDVAYMLHGCGIETGLDIDAIAEAGNFICSALGIASRSKVGNARTARKKAMQKAESEGKDTTHMKIALQWPESPSFDPSTENEEAQRIKEQFDQTQDLHAIERGNHTHHNIQEKKKIQQEEEERVRILSKAAAEASKE